MRPQRYRQAFSLIEAIVAVFVIVFGFLVILSIYSTSSRHATQSRNHITACILADNLLAEFRDHPYGAPAPAQWTAPKTFTNVIESEFLTGSGGAITKVNRIAKTTFTTTITYSNGSFVGTSTSGNYDDVSFTISWSEGSGVGAARAQKQLQGMVTMRREI
jgi:Tfp pilus assembly protein PilV